MEKDEITRIAEQLASSMKSARERTSSTLETPGKKAPQTLVKEPENGNLGRGVLSLGKAVEDTSKAFLQGTLRSGASIATEAYKLFGGKGSFELPESATRTEKAIAKELYGSQRVPGFQEEGDSLLDVFGASDETKKALGYGTGALLAGLDLVSGGGASKGLRYAPKLVKDLAKVVSSTKNEQQIVRALDTSLQRVPRSEIERVARELVDIDDATKAEDYLKTFIDSGKATATAYPAREVYARLGEAQARATKLAASAEPELAAEARTIANQINGFRKYAEDTQASVSVLNKILGDADEAMETLTSIRGKSLDDKIDDIVRGTKIEAPPEGAAVGFVRNADGTRRFDEAAVTAPVRQTKAIEAATSAVEKTRLMDDVASGRLPQAPNPEQLVLELPEEGRAFIEANPGSIPLRGIEANTIEEARDAYLDNVRRGIEFDTVAIRGKDGNIIDDAADGTKFFSEDEIKAALMEGKKERKFITTVKESPNTIPAVAKEVQSFYDPLTNDATLRAAADILQRGDDEALAYVKNAKAPTAETNAVAELLIEKYQRDGRVVQAIDLVEYVAAQATSQGQAIQALAMWNRLTPAGVLRYAERTLKQADKGSKLTPELAKKLVDMASETRKMEAGWQKSFETAKMMKLIADEIPVGIGKKLSLIHTSLLLLNPKTWMRNLIGNSGFSALEQVSDLTAAGLDSAMSLVTGVRTKVPPSILVQSKGALRGGIEGWKETLEGVNTLAAKTQFDIPQTAVFKGGVGKALETMLNVSLRVPDRVFYQAAYDGSLYQQIKAANITAKKKGLEPVLKATSAMKEVAHYDALYRTFQDDSTIATLLSGLKRGLNKVTGNEDFGLGDVIIKFPKTPGNLLARGIDYSPVGFFNTVFQAVRPLIGKRTFNQKAFVESFSRALVGSTTLVGTGAILHQLGVLTGKSDDDRDVAASKQANALGDYRINASALKRFVMSGMDPEQAKMQKGDTLVSYDWFQPAAAGIAMGANIAQNKGLEASSFLGQIADGVLKGADTLTQQPVLKNLLNFSEDVGYYGVFGAAGRQLATLPASFVPTLLNQVRQLLDNDARNTYSPDSFEYAWNLTKNRIPGLAQTLPQRVDPYGNDQEVYQGGTNNLFNVLFNPMFVNQYKDDPAISMVLDVFSETGDRGAVPDAKKQKQTINGEEKQLGPKTYYKFQKFAGEKTRFYLTALAEDPEFQALQPEQKSKYIANMIRDIQVASKIIVLGDRPKTVAGRVQAIIQQHYGN